MTKINVPNKIKKIMEKLTHNKHEVYVVGGAIRDTLLGLNPKDWDLFTSASQEEIKRLFPYAKLVGGSQRQSKLITYVIGSIEISQFRGNGPRTTRGKTLVQHQSTCDFTIGSIACDKDGNLYDSQNGVQDILNKEFGFVGNPKDRIQEDPLRLLRAVRFMAKLGFSFRHKGALVEYSSLINQLPKERIREEFLKILRFPSGLELLIRFGLLHEMIPEYKKVVGVPGGQHHNETVDQHLYYTYKTARDTTRDWRIWLGAFLHDIGKGETYSTDDTGQVHFYEHERVGAKYVSTWMKEHSFSKKDIDFVTCLVRHHMWAFADADKKRSFIKHFQYFKDNGVDVLDFVILTYCDNQGNQANTRKTFEKYLRRNKLLPKYYELLYSKEPFSINGLALQGRDLLELGMKPGPEIGVLLQNMFDLVMEGELVNERFSLLPYAKKYIKTKEKLK